MKSLLLMLALVGSPVLAAETLTEWEIQDLKDLHRERLTEWLLPRVGEDASLLSWQDLTTLAGQNWNSLTANEKRHVLLSKLEQDKEFQTKVEKAFADWKKKLKNMK